MERILFCTDFSENADAAFEAALSELERRPHAELVLLHVIPEPEAQFWKSYVYEVEDVDQKAKADIDEKVTQTYQSRLPQGTSMHVEMRIGRDAQEIITVARGFDIDLIIMGRQGHSRLEKVLFGNVTDKVIRHAPCPVLVVPPRV